MTDIQGVVDRLAAIERDARRKGSRLGYFAALYRRMTQEVQRGIADGEFRDGPLMERLDVAFAERYFDAYGAWQEGRPVTESWRVAFEAAESSKHVVLQHLLLGINAHVNLDLGIVTANLVEPADLTSIKADFDHINFLIRRLIDQIQGCINRLSPGFWLVDVLGGRLDEGLFGFSLEAARDFAWNLATELSGASASDRDTKVASTDRHVAVLSRHLLSPGLLPRVGFRVFRVFEEGDVARVIDGLGREAPAARR